MDKKTARSTLAFSLGFTSACFIGPFAPHNLHMMLTTFDFYVLLGFSILLFSLYVITRWNYLFDHKYYLPAIFIIGAIFSLRAIYLASGLGAFDNAVLSLSACAVIVLFIKRRDKKRARS